VERRNEALLAHLLSFDAVVIAGEAKSHCVARTIDDLLEEPKLAERTYLLEDCSSPVVVPGAVDYTEEANAAFAAVRGGRHARRALDGAAGGLDQALAASSERHARNAASATSTCSGVGSFVA